jgi:hypothetical protein
MTFDRADPPPPPMFPTPGKYSLVVEHMVETPDGAGPHWWKCLSKTLTDKSSCLNIIYVETFDGIGVSRTYRCSNGPPGMARARARKSPVNFVPGRPDTILPRAVSCQPTGCADGPGTGPRANFVPG